MSCRDFLKSWESKRSVYCRNSRCFVREGKIGFTQAVVLIVSLLKKSIDLELHNFFSIMDFKAQDKFTKSAFSQSRYKIEFEFFYDWVKHLASEFYAQSRGDKNSSNRLYKTWNNHIIHAIDGTSAYLFAKGDLKEVFGCHRNNYGETVPMARIGVRYDVLNKIAICGLMEANKMCERKIAYKLLKDVSENVITLYDSFYHTYAFMFAHTRQKLKFVMRGRLKDNFIKDFLASDLEDQIVTIQIKQSDLIQIKANEGIEMSLDSTLIVRMIRVDIGQKDPEVLISNLLDKIQFPTSDFKELYRQRWEIETYFDKVKNILQLEIFSGYSAKAVRQDFYSILFISSLHYILSPDQTDLEEINSRRTIPYTINQSTTLGIFKKIIPILLGDGDKDIIQTLVEFRKECLSHLEPIRSNRTYKRTKNKPRLTGKYKTFTNHKNVG